MRTNKAKTQEESGNKRNCTAFSFSAPHSFTSLHRIHSFSAHTHSITADIPESRMDRKNLILGICQPYVSNHLFLVVSELSAMLWKREREREAGERVSTWSHCKLHTRNFSPKNRTLDRKICKWWREEWQPTTLYTAMATATITNSSQTYFILCFAYHIYLSWAVLPVCAKQTLHVQRFHPSTQSGSLFHLDRLTHTRIAIPDGDGVHIKINIKRTRSKMKKEQERRNENECRRRKEKKKQKKNNNSRTRGRRHTRSRCICVHTQIRKVKRTI